MSVLGGGKPPDPNISSPISIDDEDANMDFTNPTGNLPDNNNPNVSKNNADSNLQNTQKAIITDKDNKQRQEILYGPSDHGPFHIYVENNCKDFKELDNKILSIDTIGRNRIRIKMKDYKNANYLINNKNVKVFIDNNLDVYVPKFILMRQGVIRDISTEFTVEYIKNKIRRLQACLFANISNPSGSSVSQKENLRPGNCDVDVGPSSALLLQCKNRESSLQLEPLKNVFEDNFIFDSDDSILDPDFLSDPDDFEMEIDQVTASSPNSPLLCDPLIPIPLPWNEKSAVSLNNMSTKQTGRPKNDTGASVSVIFKNRIFNNKVVDVSKKLRINGISGSVVSSGTMNITLQIDKVNLCLEFQLEPDLQMHGILGSNFFYDYFAKIDYEKFLFWFSYHNNRHVIPIQTTHQINYMSIPARCEVIKYCKVNINEDCVLPNELCEGVFIAGTLVMARQNLFPVKILNVRDQEVTLRNLPFELPEQINY
ncbi:unnamed protein product [Psylliodes chrysocephalus]|uniref:Uncharacterized protein n=1 Tax=Psylliodes chrysocephalus TaxID=3402493 RepID=A0A9P0CPZ5_9CUCU|nr:unnamed protein product [Psylliodes chrysocephala]